MKRSLTKLLAVLVSVGFMAHAFGQDQDAIIGDFEPFGDVDWVDEPYENDAAGAIVLTHTTPDDQQANFDVVGPDDYYEHFDFSDEPGEEYVLDDLAPGVYSIAATDEGLALVHTVVEVTVGETVRVEANLEAWDQEGFAPGAYDPYAGYGVADRGAYGGYPGYPYGAYRMGATAPYTGEPGMAVLSIDARTESMDTIVTGPNGYSEEFEGDVLTRALWPGVYAIASTEEGYDLGVTTVEIEADTQVDLTPTLVEVDVDAGVDTQQDAADGQDGQDAQDGQQDGQQDGGEQDGQDAQNGQDGQNGQNGQDSQDGAGDGAP